MHIAFTVPLWAMIGFGTIAYPTIGAMVASFLMRTSAKRLPGFAVFAAGAAWPATLALGVAAFPVWLVIWLTKNYGAAVKTMLARGKQVGGSDFSYNEKVKMVRNFGTLMVDNFGFVKETKEGASYVEFGGLGSHWVANDFLARRE